MKPTILDRYLLREAGGAWLAVTVVLLAIMLSTRFTRFLAQAAAGELPRELLFKVAALSSLQYLVILIPVSLMLAIMLSLGRLYRDNEIAAMTGCGVGLVALYRPFVLLGILLALLTAALAFQVGPWAGRTVDYSIKNAARLIQFNPFEEGRFTSVMKDRAVFYTERMSAGGAELETVIAQIEEAQGGVSFVTARRGTQHTDPVTGERSVHLFDGRRYRGIPGQAGFDVMRFDELATRVSPPEFDYTRSKRKLATMAELLGSDDLADRAELEWRVAAPVSVLILTLLAVPLAYIAPRQGRYGKVVWGVGAYLLYSQLMGLGQAWLAKGRIPVEVGLWWVHALMLVWAVYLVGLRLNLWRRRA
ncbi:LPS export ABC transporter permease LptF [Sinimarinibacterium sp. NLF-5-8]|nr:LPS export ABC transporter permease LptF [Sinimarinibacterium sp. NLF-5-8]